MDAKRIKVSISFSAQWVLDRKNDEKLPIETIVDEIEKKYKITDKEISFTDGMFYVNVSNEDQDIQEEITSLIKNLYGQKISDDDFSVCTSLDNSINSNDTDMPAASLMEKLGLSSERLTTEENKSSAARTPVIEQIHDLVGCSEFIQLCDECVKVAPFLKESNTLEAFAKRTYLVSINDGYGLTTYLKKFSELLSELGLFDTNKNESVLELQLPTENVNDSFAEFLSWLGSKCRRRIVCIDISEWINKTKERKFRDLLKVIDTCAGEGIFFFRIPFVEHNIRKQISLDLNDYLFVKDISVVPFTINDLDECANRYLQQKGFSMDQTAWDIFHERIALERSDGKFYGVNTINKILSELLYRKQLFNAENELNDKYILGEQIKSLSMQDFLQNDYGSDMLDSLIGMKHIKEKINEIIAQIEMSLKNENLGSPCIHMRFLGNPGTGKTTVARILGKILKEKQILRNGSFFEFSGRDLCGRYVGETAPKTAAICRDAYGSVLFIDEAYSLYYDDRMSHADFGKEAIDTLVTEMENHRSDLMVIMAGYRDEMQTLMDANVGLKSRMPYQIEFPNFTRQELAEIFFTFADKSFVYDDQFKKTVEDYFNSLSDEIIQAKEFSNARYVRNLYERTWGKAAMRAQIAQTPCDRLTIEDFALATSEKDFQNIMGTKIRRIGFM